MVAVTEAQRLDVAGRSGKRSSCHDSGISFLRRLLTRGAAGVIDCRGTVYKELTPREMTDRVSDHLPLSVEFVKDRSSESIARTLGVDLGAPEPFAGIPK